MNFDATESAGFTSKRTSDLFVWGHSLGGSQHWPNVNSQTATSLVSRRQQMAVGQNQWYHFGVGAPPILVYFSGDGIGILTHGQMSRKRGVVATLCDTKHIPRGSTGIKKGIGCGSKSGYQMACPGKWKHGPNPAVCPSCLTLSHTHFTLGVSDEMRQPLRLTQVWPRGERHSLPAQRGEEGALCLRGLNASSPGSGRGELPFAEVFFVFVSPCWVLKGIYHYWKCVSFFFIWVLTNWKLNIVLWGQVK